MASEKQVGYLKNLLEGTLLSWEDICFNLNANMLVKFKNGYKDMEKLNNQEVDAAIVYMSGLKR